MSSSPSPNPDSIVRSVFRRQVFSQRLRSAGLGVLGIGWLWLLSDVADDTMLFYKGAQRGLRLAAESAEVKKASVKLFPSRHAMSCTVPVTGPEDSEGQMKVKAVTRDPVPFGSTFLYNTVFSGEWELISVEIQREGRKGWISLDCSSSSSSSSDSSSSEREKSKDEDKKPGAKSQSPKGQTLIV